MRKSFLAVVFAAGLLVASAPMATANSRHYVGSCTVDAQNGFAGFYGTGVTTASCSSVQVRTHMNDGVGQKTEYDGSVTLVDVGLSMSQTDHNWNPGSGWVGFPLSCC
jgi:hypothetical protein